MKKVALTCIQKEKERTIGVKTLREPGATYTKLNEALARGVPR